MSKWLEIKFTEHTKYAIKFINNEPIIGIKFSENNRILNIEVVHNKSTITKYIYKNNLGRTREITDKVKKGILERIVIKLKLREIRASGY